MFMAFGRLSGQPVPIASASVLPDSPDTIRQFIMMRSLNFETHHCQQKIRKIGWRRQYPLLFSSTYAQLQGCFEIALKHLAIKQCFQCYDACFPKQLSSLDFKNSTD